MHTGFEIPSAFTVFMAPKKPNAARDYEQVFDRKREGQVHKVS